MRVVTDTPWNPEARLRERTTTLLSTDSPDERTLDRLMPIVYEELRRIARRELARERPDHTLQTTALVHEAYLRLVDQTRVEWADEKHFFSVAAMAMRRVLVDHARKHLAAKRGGGRTAISLDPAALSVEDRAETLVAIDRALDRLARLDERLSRVVECRFFAGLSEEETARVLDVTPRTVRRYWVKAKGLLAAQLCAS